MNKSNYGGIDYSVEGNNIDQETGVRYGIIDIFSLPHWGEDSEADHGEPTCPRCGEAIDSNFDDVPDSLIDFQFDALDEWEHQGSEYACKKCKVTYDSYQVFPETPDYHFYDADGIRACQRGDSTDVCFSKSPYYTWAQYCSPCVPGAGNLNCHTDPDVGAKTYCPGHDWFDDGKAPFPVYSVESDQLILPDST